MRFHERFKVGVATLIASGAVLWTGCSPGANDSADSNQQEIAQLRSENAQLPELRQQHQEVERLRKELQDIHKLRAQRQELARLRKENEQLRTLLAKAAGGAPAK